MLELNYFDFYKIDQLPVFYKYVLCNLLGLLFKNRITFFKKFFAVKFHPNTIPKIIIYKVSEFENIHFINFEEIIDLDNYL